MKNALDWKEGECSVGVSTASSGEVKMSATEDTNLVMLIGELRGDMKEGIRQRAETFDLLRGLSAQFQELAATFNAHAGNEEEWRGQLQMRHQQFESAINGLSSRVAAIELKAKAEELAAGQEPKRIGVKGPLAAVASFGVAYIFSDNWIELGKHFAEFISKHFKW